MLHVRSPEQLSILLVRNELGGETMAAGATVAKWRLPDFEVAHSAAADQDAALDVS
jgi:hypothetical protein